MLCIANCKMPLKVWLNRYSWGAGKLGFEYCSWFTRLWCFTVNPNTRWSQFQANISRMVGWMTGSYRDICMKVTPQSIWIYCSCVQIGLKLEAGDCPPLNINAMRSATVKSVLNPFMPFRFTKMYWQRAKNSNSSDFDYTQLSSCMIFFSFGHQMDRLQNLVLRFY